MIKEIRFTDQQLEEIYASRVGLDEKVGLLGKGWAILTNVKTGDITKIQSVNLIGNAGDQYYAQLAAAESPGDDFKASGAGLILGTGSATPGKTDTTVQTFLSGSGMARKTGYPKTSDADSDNTGDGVDILTWTYEYATNEGNGTGITEGAIVDDRTTPTSCLTHFRFAASFNKTTSDTLKVIINHQFNGV